MKQVRLRVLIRQTLTQELRERLDTFKTHLGRFAKDLSIEGQAAKTLTSVIEPSF